MSEHGTPTTPRFVFGTWKLRDDTTVVAISRESTWKDDGFCSDHYSDEERAAIDAADTDLRLMLGEIVESVFETPLVPEVVRSTLAERDGFAHSPDFEAFCAAVDFGIE